MKDLKVTINSKFAVLENTTVPKNEQTVLTISGYASVNRINGGEKNVDRDNEVYDIPSLDIENFKNNGPILFGHDWSAIIGEVTRIEKTFEGLYVEAEIHKVPGFESVFYGVQNGLIKAFSISAIPKAFNYLEDEDALELLDAELIEISVLAVPSNAQSLFNVTNAKSLTINAKEIATQNNLTLCELKGICSLREQKELKEKGVNMKIENKEPEVAPVAPVVEPVAVVTPEPVTEPVVEVKPVVTPEPIVEPVVEVTSEPVKPLDENTIASALVIAQQKAEDIKAEKEEAATREAEEAEATTIAEAKARVDNAAAYIKEQTDAFVAMPNEDIDTDKIEEFYELVSDSVEAIETKITEVIQAQLKA